MSSQGGGLKLRSGYALPPFQAPASRLILIDAPVSSCSSRRSGEDHPSGLDWLDMRTNAVADSISRRLHGFVCQVRVASGCLNLSVTEELADHGKALAEGQRPGRK